MQKPQPKVGVLDSGTSKVDAKILPLLEPRPNYNFHAIVTKCEYRDAFIQLHRDCVRDCMLSRIVMFGGDDDFVAIVTQLADCLGITHKKATDILWPTSHAIYKAAESADAE